MMPDRASPSHAVRAHAGLFFMAILWALNFIIIKIGLERFPPLAFNALRFPLAALTLFVILRASGPLARPDRADLPRIAALGLLGNLGYQLFFITGLARTSAGNASLLLAATPILTALLSAAVGHERPPLRVWLGVFATFGGIVLVVLGSESQIGATQVGDLLMIGASACWSIYTVGSSRYVAKYGSNAFTAWTLWIGTVGIVLAGVPALVQTDWHNAGMPAWLAVAFTGILGLGIAYPLWYYGVRQIGNTRTAVYSNIVPVFALLFAWLWLAETPSAWQIVGAVVIIGGVTLARRPAPQRVSV